MPNQAGEYFSTGYDERTELESMLNQESLTHVTVKVFDAKHVEFSIINTSHPGKRLTFLVAVEPMTN